MDLDRTPRRGKYVGALRRGDQVADVGTVLDHASVTPEGTRVRVRRPDGSTAVRLYDDPWRIVPVLRPELPPPDVPSAGVGAGDGNPDERIPRPPDDDEDDQ